MAIPVNPVIILWGQSNTQGSPPNTTEGGADFAATTLPVDSSIRFVCSDNFGEHTSVGSMGMVPWGDTVGGDGSRMPHFGPEQQCAAALKAAGWTNMTFLKWVHNGQPINNFRPGGADWYRLHRVITIGRPRAATITPFLYGFQGEADALSTSSQAQADDWGNRFQDLFNQVQAAVGQPLVGGKMCGRLCSAIYGGNQGTTAPYVPNVRAAQMAAATSGRWINSDSFAIYGQDLLHFTGAGMHQHGTALANLLLSVMA